MLRIDSYWNYENRLGILMEYDDDSFGGFYLEKEALNWKPVTEWDVVQWFKDSGKISQADFEDLFGKIGIDLPSLPLE